MKLNDLTGQTFERLTVIERTVDAVKPSGKKETQWLCRCSCDKLIAVRYKNLVSGHTISCGCIRKKAESLPKAEKILDGCLYVPMGVVCKNLTKCNTCGWNPENTELKEKRLKKLKKGCVENARIKSYTANENTSVL